jgi:hypothetical protein
MQAAQAIKKQILHQVPDEGRVRTKTFWSQFSVRGSLDRSACSSARLIYLFHPGVWGC